MSYMQLCVSPSRLLPAYTYFTHSIVCKSYYTLLLPAYFIHSVTSFSFAPFYQFFFLNHCLQHLL